MCGAHFGPIVVSEANAASPILWIGVGWYNQRACDQHDRQRFPVNPMRSMPKGRVYSHSIENMGQSTPLPHKTDRFFCFTVNNWCSWKGCILMLVNNRLLNRVNHSSGSRNLWGFAHLIMDNSLRLNNLGHTINKILYRQF